MEQCPRQSTTSPTLKERALEIVELDCRGLLDSGPEDIDSLSLDELKLEVDSAMALVTCLATTGFGKSESHQQAFAAYLQASTPPDGYLLQALKEHGTDYVFPFLINNVRIMQAREGSQAFFTRLERHRAAYYDRTPLAHDQEKHYESIDNLIGAGINTSNDRIPHLLQGIRLASERQKIDRETEAEIARKSGHLAILLAKLSMADQSRFVDLLSRYEFLDAATVELQTAEQEQIALLNARLFDRMRELFPDMESEYSHRRHVGCPASVGFEGYDSAITELWQLAVGALDKAGFWKD